MEDILKQILTNQQVIMLYLLEKNKSNEEIIEHELKKTGEMILDIIRKNKHIFNSLYEQTIDYRKYTHKEIIQIIEKERKKYIDLGVIAISQEEKLAYKEVLEALANLEFLF